MEHKDIGDGNTQTIRHLIEPTNEEIARLYLLKHKGLGVEFDFEKKKAKLKNDVGKVKKDPGSQKYVAASS